MVFGVRIKPFVDAWWRAAGEIVPAWLYLPLFKHRPAHTLNIVAPEQPGGIAFSAMSDPEALRAVLKQRSGAPAPINVTFAEGALFTREVRIPRAARNEADAILSLDLSQAAPFPADEVLWGLGPWSRKGSELVATQYLIKRARFEGLRGALRSLGYAPRLVRPAIRNVGRPIYDDRARLDRAYRTWGAVTAVAFGAACLVGVWGLSDRVAVGEAELAALNMRVEELEAQAVALRNNRAAAAEVGAGEGDVFEAILADAGRVKSLQNLTALLPDDVWISGLSLNNQTLRLSGFAGMASTELVPLIETQAWASETRLTAPTSRDPRSGRERFELSFSLVQTGAP